MKNYLEFAMPIVMFVTIVYSVLILYGIFRAHGFNTGDTIYIICMPLVIMSAIEGSNRK